MLLWFFLSFCRVLDVYVLLFLWLFAQYSIRLHWVLIHLRHAFPIIEHVERNGFSICSNAYTDTIAHYLFLMIFFIVVVVFLQFHKSIFFRVGRLFYCCAMLCIVGSFYVFFSFRFYRNSIDFTRWSSVFHLTQHLRATQHFGFWMIRAGLFFLFLLPFFPHFDRCGKNFFLEYIRNYKYLCCVV